jgi:hypothetical protein
MLVRPLVRPSVGPHITSKSDYVAIASRLGFGVTSLLYYVSVMKGVKYLFFVSNILLKPFPLKQIMTVDYSDTDPDPIRSDPIRADTDVGFRAGG